MGRLRVLDDKLGISALGKHGLTRTRGVEASAAVADLLKGEDCVRTVGPREISAVHRRVGKRVRVEAHGGARGLAIGVEERARRRPVCGRGHCAGCFFLLSTTVCLTYEPSAR